MIVAHLSDLHLGHRGYESRPGARHVQERDVARAFQSAASAIAGIGPDLVLIAGDVFDTPEPPAAAIVAMSRTLEHLRTALPDTQVFMAAGARDTPRLWGDPGALAAVDTLPNVEAATGAPRSVWLEEGGIHVFLLPHRSILDDPHPDVRPDPDARWNVLLAYGEVEEGRTGRKAHVLDVDRRGWDYVALGSRHLHEVVAPRVVYPGSVERVGPEPWREAHRAKGFVTADLESGEVRFHEVAGRPVVALAPIRWDPSRPERMNERIRELRDELPGGMPGKVVRLRLEDAGPEALSHLDPELLSALRSDAVHLSVEVDPGDARPAAEEQGPLGERVIRRLPEEDREELAAVAGTLLAEASGDGAGR